MDPKPCTPAGFGAFLERRRAEGITNGRQLFGEIVARSYTGSYSHLARFLSPRTDAGVIIKKIAGLERVAQVFGSALDDCLTVPLSGLARHGREAREIGRLFAIGGSDHWHSLPGSDLHGRSCAGRSVRRRP